MMNGSSDASYADGDTKSLCDDSSAVASEDMSMPTPEQSRKEANTSSASSKGTRMVVFSRLLFLVFLIIVASGMAAAAYKIARRVEYADFETRFRDFARQVMEVSRINAKNIFDRYHTMSLQFTAYALDTGKTWPFVQMPRFEEQARNALEATGATMLLFCPVVREDQLSAYNEYTQSHREWMQLGLDLNNITESLDSFPLAPNVSSTIYPNLSLDMRELPIYLPVAQISNWHQVPVYYNTETGLDPDVPLAFDIMNTTGSLVMSGVKNSASPASFMSTPVFDSLDTENAQVVGLFSGYLRWYKNFENLLPAGTEPLILEVQHCDDFYSYMIRGTEIEYLGPGNGFHDRRYESLEDVGTFVPYATATGCDFILHVYPTEEFENAYRTSRPSVAAGTVAGIFAVTAIFFVLYNVVVEFRQTSLESKANKNIAIVESLFPETVRDRLVNFTSPSSEEEDPSVALMMRPGSSLSPTSPIADSFESASVLFADISGFTNWSSERQPASVFILLESLYNAFDEIATRLGVFKVETIGDCYLAVVGLPELRDDHAVVMVKFARACLNRMAEILPELEETLGNGTMDLAIRVGIHSGPVTAGVLRGAKSRFQLFGDTVNTASRMESNGQPGRIHVSSATADELTRLGKGKWLSPREDAISAKGKGEMKTFWIRQGNSSSLATSFHQAQTSCPVDPDELRLSI